MALTRNLYANYKKDTRYLVYWLIQTTNRLLKSDAQETGTPPSGLNTSGQTTINNVLSMAETIAQRGEPVPTVIYKLIKSIIEARTTVYKSFEQLSLSSQDPDLQRSNEGHKHFIDILSQAFSILGGDEWQTSNEERDPSHAPTSDDVEMLILNNKFGALHVEANISSGDSDNHSEDDDGFKVEEQTKGSRKTSKKSSGKGKKVKRPKKGKRAKKSKKAQPQAAQSGILMDIPLEDFKIIESADTLNSDFLMAAYSAVQEWAQLRAYVQGVWRQAAYDGLNTAVAGALSNMAIAMVKRTTGVIFVDFPGCEAYSTVMNTITRGDPEKAQGHFSLQLHLQDGNGETPARVVDAPVDVKEQFLVHAYQSLMEFFVDFQKNRNGRPTKNMNARLQKWTPTLDLQSATEEERREWRHLYTIAWLYDLVNVFSSVVVQQNAQDGERYTCENVDWSVSGPWEEHRRLYGLVEFAGDITRIAMQKAGTNVNKMILPQHVFQLQCIVDSFAVSRGWAISGLFGHMMRPPAPEFSPRRDVDQFLDRHHERMGKGFIHSVDMLQHVWDQTVRQTGEDDFHVDILAVLGLLKEDFEDWLGETRYKDGLGKIPPSRFSAHNPNGLYEYSPFLCGTGLLDGLDLVYRFSMILWDRMQEPTLTIHIHNMLVEKGYLDQPVGLYAALQHIFKQSLFADGKIPTSDFSKGVLHKLRETDSRVFKRQRNLIKQRASNSTGGVHKVLDIEANRFFREKSHLAMYKTADWNPDGIPDKDVEPGTFLFFMRLYQTKITIDPKTKKRRLPDTPFVCRTKEIGMTDDDFFTAREQFAPLFDCLTKEEKVPLSILHSLTPEGLTAGSELKSLGASISTSEVTGNNLLDILRYDIYRDVCGMAPLSSINYIQVTVMSILFFLTLERKLREVNHPIYVDANERPRSKAVTKRFALTMMLLASEDDQALKAAAESFKMMGTDLLHHVYWDTLTPSLTKAFYVPEEGKPDIDECVVM